VLGPDPPIARLTAALRALADVGDPRADLRRGVITAEQLERVGTLFGRGAAERVGIERAWMLGARLRRLDGLGRGMAPGRARRPRVACIDRRSGVIANRMLGTFAVAALTHMLRQMDPGEQAGRAGRMAAGRTAGAGRSAAAGRSAGAGRMAA